MSKASNLDRIRLHVSFSIAEKYWLLLNILILLSFGNRGSFIMLSVTFDFFLICFSHRIQFNSS